MQFLVVTLGVNENRKYRTCTSPAKPQLRAKDVRERERVRNFNGIKYLNGEEWHLEKEEGRGFKMRTMVSTAPSSSLAFLNFASSPRMLCKRK